MSSSYCPNCGSSLKKKAKFCPECGSDEKTGWKSLDEIQEEAVDLPQDTDYEDFLEREGLGKRPKQTKSLWFFLTALVLLLALVISSFL